MLRKRIYRLGVLLNKRRRGYFVGWMGMMLLHSNICFSQKLSKHELSLLYERANHNEIQCRYDSAALIFTKIINDDSLYYEIYFERALSYLWNRRDSLALLDIQHCLNMNPKKRKRFPDAYLNNLIKTYRPPPGPRPLDERHLPCGYVYVMQGVCEYLTFKQTYCSTWQGAIIANSDCFIAQELIKLYCK